MSSVSALFQQVGLSRVVAVVQSLMLVSPPNEPDFLPLETSPQIFGLQSFARYMTPHKAVRRWWIASGTRCGSRTSWTENWQQVFFAFLKMEIKSI